MGGSAKQVVKKVAKETGYTGSDLDKGAQAVGAKGSEAIEYTKKKGSEVVEGVKEHGGALATGVGQGLGTLGTQAMAGLKHNLDQVASVFMPQSGGGSQKAQGSSANYSQQGKRSKSGAQKKGDLQSQERKGATGKQKLYARRKTA
jgi:hypothetical protein